MDCEIRLANCAIGFLAKIIKIENMEEETETAITLIIDFLSKNKIYGKLKTDYFGRRIEFFHNEFLIKISIHESITIDEFKNLVDKMYLEQMKNKLEQMKNKAKIYKSAEEDWFTKVKNFKGLFN
jgi:hypothetical protein